MDMHPVKLVTWVNSAFFWFYCIFVFNVSDAIIRLNIIMKGQILWNLSG